MRWDSLEGGAVFFQVQYSLVRKITGQGKLEMASWKEKTFFLRDVFAMVQLLASYFETFE
jgi:hypothetical protein